MLKKENLMRMAEMRGEWCVSVYMPLSDTESKKKRRRLKNMMFEAEKKLHRLSVEPGKIARLLGPVEMIMENPGFWENRTAGIAAFFTPASFAWYSLRYEFDDLVVVTDRFHLKPLLRDAAENGRFYLLTLSEDQIKLFEASELGINEVYVKGIPRNPACFLNPETEEGLAGEDEKRARLMELFRKVDKALVNYLKTDDAPLILAGDELLHPMYYDANSYENLIKVGIGGSVDNLPPDRLLKKALAIVKPVFRRRREGSLKTFDEKIERGLASNNFSKIFHAARAGRIETLFVPVGRQKWGTFDNATGELQINARPEPGDKDLLCVASTRTLRRGGEVFVVPPKKMPGKSLIAAVWRN
jgi:hypothetical protein